MDASLGVASPPEATTELSGAAQSGRRGSRRTSRRAPRLIHRLIPLLLVLIGVGVFVYPVVATQYNNTKQREFASQYNREVAAAPSEDLASALAAAREYNATLPGVPILDPWLKNVATDPGSSAFKTYMGQLHGYSAMARVRVPRLGIDLPVRHGTEDDTISQGAGHLYGTSLPVGGVGSHAVLTSHTGMAKATLFDHLVDAREGDAILIDVLGETLAYEVDQIKIVLPDQIGDLTAVEGQDYLTLFTCTPYAVNTHRLLVRGHRVDYAPEKIQAAEQSASDVAMESWMWWLLAGASAGLIALLVIVVGIWRSGRRKRSRAARLRV